jgi:hypothetical protein
MAKLFFFIPFKKNKLKADKDLAQQANEFSNTFSGMTNERIGNNIGDEIDEGISVEYIDSNFTVTADDYIIVFAHGGEDDDKLCSNAPKLTTDVDTVITKLEAADAEQAAKILFMCCYSSHTDHIAKIWKRKHAGQAVYGSDTAISNLYAATRTQIRNCCAALSLVP